MAEGNRSKTCQQCGEPVQTGDRFCGSCGAVVTNVTPEDTQVIPRPAAAAQATPTRSNRTFLVAGLVGIVLAILAGGGALAMVGFGSDNNLLGGSGPEPVAPPPTQEFVPSPETTEESIRSEEQTQGPDGGASGEPDETSTEATEPEIISVGAVDPEAEAEEAAGDYYRAAGLQDWEYTYEHLDSETQSMFTEEEWFRKNQYYWDLNPTVYHILSVDLLSDSDETITEVTVRITGEDGSSFDRTTYWVLEDGDWLHQFGPEEIDSFMPDLSYEEFVEANGG